MSQRAAHFGLFTLLAAASCSRQPLPDLPQVDLSALKPTVRGAIEVAFRAADQNPRDAAVVARLGMLLHAHGQYLPASAAYRRAALLDAANAVYPYYLGTVLAAAGNYSEAVKSFRTALLHQKTVPVRLALAGALYSLGKSDDAAREYRSLVATDPGLAAAWYGLGLCQKGEEAVSSLERALTLFPRYGAARFALAGVYRQLGRKAQADAALENYERDKFTVPPLEDPALAAVQALDSSPAGLLRASQTLEHSGQLAEATQVLERAVAADPALTQGFVNLIALYGSQGQPEKAELAYRKAVVAEPHNAAAHYNFGVLSLQRERLTDAKAAFEAAIAADPNYAEALDSLGAVVETSGDLNRAADLFRRAISAKTSLRLAHFHLGRIYANQKRYPEAIAELTRSLEPADAQTPGFLYALGATHARAGDYETATEVLKKAAESAQRQGQTDLAVSIGRDLARLLKQPRQ